MASIPSWGVDTCDAFICPGSLALRQTSDGVVNVVQVDSINITEQSAKVNGKQVPLNELAGIAEKNCVLGMTSRIRYQTRPGRGEKICAGRHVKNDATPGIVLGVFANGDILFSGKGVPPRRVQGKRYMALNIAREQSDPHARFELIRNLQQINQLMKKMGVGECSLDAERSPEPEAALAPGGCELPAANSALMTPENKLKFGTLLARGVNAPLTDFLQLWDETATGAELDSPFFACESGEQKAFSVDSADCRPKTLYSWGTREKLETIKERLGPGKTWEGLANPGAQIKSGRIFSTISAVSTYGYGAIPVRFEIRASAPYMFTGTYMQDGEKLKGVAIRKDNYHDFTFEDAGLVESWSFGTPELYDEIVRDILRFRSGKRASVYSETYSYNEALSAKTIDAYMRRLYGQGADGYEQNEEVLKENLLEVLREILANEGRLIFPSGTCGDFEQHYSTGQPNYINPRAAKK